MEQLSAATLARDIRVPLVYSSDDIRVIAGEIGVAVTDGESAIILDHLDREVGQLARTAAASALHARIIDLLTVVSSVDSPSASHWSGRRRTWVTG
jgi:hypothetical protein